MHVCMWKKRDMSNLYVRLCLLFPRVCVCVFVYAGVIKLIWPM